MKIEINGSAFVYLYDTYDEDVTITRNNLVLQHGDFSNRTITVKARNVTLIYLQNAVIEVTKSVANGGLTLFNCNNVTLHIAEGVSHIDIGSGSITDIISESPDLIVTF